MITPNISLTTIIIIINTITMIIIFFINIRFTEITTNIMITKITTITTLIFPKYFSE